MSCLPCGNGKYTDTSARRICSENYLSKEIQLIQNYAARNGCMEHIVNSIIKRTLCEKNTNNIHELILSKHKCNKNSQVTQLIELSKKQFTTAAKK